MQSKEQELYSFIKEQAKKKKTNLSDIAKGCNMCRTTLYRVMKGLSPITEQFEKDIATTLGLDQREKYHLSNILNGLPNRGTFDSAYEILDKLIFGDNEYKKEQTFNFAVYLDGERYFRNNHEIYNTIFERYKKNTTSIKIYVKFCMTEDSFQLMNSLINNLYSLSPKVEVEHLINIPNRSPEISAQYISNLIALTKLKNYKVFYREINSETDTSNIFENSILLEREYVNNNELKKDYAFFSFDTLSQCLIFNNSNLYSFFISAFTSFKTLFNSSLVYTSNVAQIIEPLAKFYHENNNILIKNALSFEIIPAYIYDEVYDRCSEEECLKILQKIYNKKIYNFELKSYWNSLREFINDRYKSTFLYNCFFIINSEGLINFAKTGMIFDCCIPMPVLEVSERKQVFEDLYKRIKSNDSKFNFYITDKILLQNKLCLLINSSRGILIDYESEKLQNMRQNIFVNNKSFNSLFLHYFIEHIPYTNVYSKEKTLMFLKRIIDKL